MALRDFPRLDNKIITAWNAMLVVGLSQAYEAFGDVNFLEKAKRLYSFLKAHCYKEPNFFHTYQKNTAKIDGFLEDYAFMTQAAMALYKNTLETLYLDDALAYTKSIQSKFKDGASPFFTYTEEPTLSSKIIEISDNVIPSSNAVMADNLWALGQLAGIKPYSEQAAAMLQNIRPYFEEGRSSDYAYWAKLFSQEVYPHYEVIIVGPDAEAMTAEFQKSYLPNILFQSSTKASELPLLKDRFFKGETYVYVCQNRVCLRPLDTVKEALDQIKNWETTQSPQIPRAPFLDTTPQTDPK